MPAHCVTSKTQLVATKELLATTLDCAVGTRLGTGGQGAAGASSKALLMLTKWREMGLNPMSRHEQSQLILTQGPEDSESQKLGTM